MYVNYFLFASYSVTFPTMFSAEWTAHSNAVFDVSWMHQESKLLTASGDQSCVLWDMVNIKSIDTFKGHTSSVKSVDWRPHNKCKAKNTRG